MNDLPLLNPNGVILPELAARMFETRKNKPIWAKQIERAHTVETLEGHLNANSGDYLCRGIVGECWPQKPEKLLEKYVARREFDADGWQRFDPKPDASSVEAAQLDTAFRVIAHWGELTGKAHDFVVRSRTDPTDVWIVDKAIFEASYDPIKPVDE